MTTFPIDLVDTRKIPLVIHSFKITFPSNTESISLKEVLLQMGFDAIAIRSLFAQKGLIGVFGVVLQEDSPVYPNDRIEIYTPILIDPKNARRKKANQNKDAQLKAKAKQKSLERSLRESS